MAGGGDSGVLALVGLGCAANRLGGGLGVSSQFYHGFVYCFCAICCFFAVFDADCFLAVEYGGFGVFGLVFVDHQYACV